MSNRTVPAAAEGLPERDFTGLEPFICDTALAVAAAKTFISDRLAGQRDDPIGVRMTTVEAELVEFMLMQAESFAQTAQTEFYAMLEASR